MQYICTYLLHFPIAQYILTRPNTLIETAKMTHHIVITFKRYEYKEEHDVGVRIHNADMKLAIYTAVVDHYEEIDGELDDAQALAIKFLEAHFGEVIMDEETLPGEPVHRPICESNRRELWYRMAEDGYILTFLN